MIDIGFDVIGDLHLKPEDSFNWENKATSLYCIVSGNISSDVRTIQQTLTHLARYYQGVFYCPGSAEYDGVENTNERTGLIVNLSKKIPNLVILHHNIVIIDGIAIIGSNCWESATTPSHQAISIEDLKYNQYRLDDMGFLHSTIEKLQRHLDVKKIIVVTNAVPNPNCYFGEVPSYSETQIPLDTIINADTESKVTHWVYGSYSKPVDATLLLPRKQDLRCVTHPLGDTPMREYFARRVTVSV